MAGALKIKVGGVYVPVSGGGCDTSHTVAATPPSTGVDGDLWFKADMTSAWVWSGGVWKQFTGITAAANKTTVGSTAPVGPAVNDVWIDTT